MTPNGIIQSVTVIDQSQSPLPNLYGPAVDFYVHCNSQLGFARAANLGLSMGRARYCMILNDDVQFINRGWWYGIMSTFARHDNLLCVSPSSPYNPPTDESPYRAPADITETVYQSLLNHSLLDGICMWAPVFDRQQLDKVPEIKPGLWFDERFWPGGGEDYDMNRRASLAGLRCVGTSESWAWHWWHSTSVGGKQQAKYDGGIFERKWRGADGEQPDLAGNKGRKEIDVSIQLTGI
jgi:GT2 family glycosyltransferase